MRPYTTLLLTFAIGFVTAPLPLAAQASPVGERIAICSDSCGPPEVAALASGRFAVAYDWAFRQEDELRVIFGCSVDLYDTEGAFVSRRGLDRGSLAYDVTPEAPSISADGFGGFVAAWHVVLFARADLLAQRFLGLNAVPEQEGPWGVGTPRYECQWNPDVAASASGRFAIAWEESPECGNLGTTSIALRLFRPNRQPATPSLLISPEDPAGDFRRPTVAIDSLGRAIVLWESVTTVRTLQGQRFRSDGRLLGSRFQIGSAGSRDLALAGLPDGSFAVAWSEPLPLGRRTVLRWFAPDAHPAGPELEIAHDESPAFVALDQHGNFALLTYFGPRGAETLRVRLFSRALVAQGEPFDLVTGLDAAPYYERRASLALLDSGRLLAAWQGSVTRLDGQVVQARHDADACVFRSDGFACDTAGDGALPEQVIPFRAGEGGPPFLADWDGDGRADPCVYRSGRFACDIAHDGRAAEAETPAVGRAGDHPLLGDLNGDGKADPCVRRGVSFLCDRARDGGAKDLRIDFGLAGDFPLLGDPDGDGRDDPCVYRNGRFLCDTAHTGGTAEMILDLRRPVPGRPAGTPLLDDLDGDGRDEACFATPTMRTCSFFHLAGGQPYRVERLAFGEAGDVPLMGDLDVF